MTISKELKKSLTELRDKLKKILLVDIHLLTADSYNEYEKVRLDAIILCDLINSCNYSDNLLKEIIYINTIRKMRNYSDIDYMNNTLDKVKQKIDEQKNILNNLGNNQVTLENIEND